MKREQIEKILSEAGLTETKAAVDSIMGIYGTSVTSLQNEISAANGKLEKFEQYKQAAESKQADIDAAVAAARTEVTKELEGRFNNERTADRRKRAREKAYNGLSDEQKSLFETLLKDEELKLSEKEDVFENWEDAVKPIKEKYKTLFPNDPEGTKGKAGLGEGESKPQTDEFEELRKLR